MTQRLRKINDPFTLFDAMFNNWRVSDYDAYHVPTFPPTNIYFNDETKDLMFEFAIAGYSKDNVSITFEGDKMIFEMKGTERPKDGLELINKGIKNSDCKVAYVVPSSKYNTEIAEAEMKDGVLIVKVPASEIIKPKLLEIK